MNVFQAVLLGFVQGLTEFLPVSSSGHLILVRRLLGLESSCLLFDLVLHLGSLVAVVVYFRREIISLLRPPFKRLGLLALATVPAAALAFLMSGFIDEVFGGGDFLWLTFALTGALLLIGERMTRRRALPGCGIGLKQAAVMGLMQAAALLPGLSRSGSTLFGGLASGADREEAAKFSFLMSVPIILGSAAVGLIGAASGTGGLELTVGWWETLCGGFAAAASGGLAIGLMMKAVKKANCRPFAYYLFGVSVLSLVLALV